MKKKLNDVQIVDVRELYASGLYTQRDLARKYNVTQPIINRAVKGIVKPKKTAVERFWENVDRSSGEDACWNWTAGRFTNGYGNFTFKNRSIGAHVFAYQVSNNVCVLPGIDVCHTCDNPMCCNPRHLIADTHKENMQGMFERGRAGFDKPKWTREQILEMKFFSDLGWHSHDIGQIMHIHANGSTVRRYITEEEARQERERMNFLFPSRNDDISRTEP